MSNTTDINEELGGLGLNKNVELSIFIGGGTLVCLVIIVWIGIVILFRSIKKRRKNLKNIEKVVLESPKISKIRSASGPTISPKNVNTNEHVLKKVYSAEIETSGESENQTTIDSEIKNDVLIARHMGQNQHDIANLTKGNIPVNEFKTSGHERNNYSSDIQFEGIS